MILIYVQGLVDLKDNQVCFLVRDYKKKCSW